MAGRRNRSSIKSLMIGAVLLISATGWATPRVKEYKFRGGPKDGAQPGNLTTDGIGNFFGTAGSGGLMTCPAQNYCGTVFEVSVDANGKGSEKTLYEFKGGTDGFAPSGGVTLDSSGNLFGTTAAGGATGWGTVFELLSNQDGTWTESVIYSFKGGADGANPGSGVIFDSAGNLYGTTTQYGLCNEWCGGTVFKLTPSNGSWTENVIYSFPPGTNGSIGPNGLTFDADNNLYGTTSRGGRGWGTVFELIPNQDGSWKEQDLYAFTDGLDGGDPSSALIFDSAGNLYGEAVYGGSFACPVDGCGVIFKGIPQGDGWKFSVAHTFNGVNGRKGQYPSGGLTFDTAGNLFGTTENGGDSTCFGFNYGCGTIFELAPAPGGGASFRVVAAFDGNHGAFPEAGVILDGAGNLYGTTVGGGDLNCDPPYGCGVVFKLSP